MFDLTRAQEAVEDFKNNIISQLQVIEYYEVNSLGLGYLIEQNKSIIRDITAFNVLVNSEGPEYALAIVRMSLDRVCKLYYLKNLKTAEQDIILLKDFLQFYKIHYDVAENEQAKINYTDAFNVFKLQLKSKLSEEDFDKLKKIADDGRVKSFPDFKKMLETENYLKDLISVFQYTSEFLHGNFGYTLTRNNKIKYVYYCILRMLIDFSKINDFHLQNVDLYNSKTSSLLDKYKNLVE